MSLSSGPLSPRSKTRVPGSLCNQKVNLRTNSETLYCSLLKEKILLLLSSITKTKRNMRRTATRTATEITQTEYSTKNIFRSISLSLRLWGFLCVRDAGHRANKISVKVPSHKFNSKNNRPVFFYFRLYSNIKLFRVVGTQGWTWIEIFGSFNDMPPKIMVGAPWWNLLDIFLLQERFVYGSFITSAQNWPKTAMPYFLD